MRKYYLFLIRKEYFEQYKNKSYVLYKIFENLYELKPYDFSYGINIFNEICLLFPKTLLNNYIDKKIPYKKIDEENIKIDSKFEETYLRIMNSCIVIKTSVNMPQILKIFNIYSKYIFVCDFISEDYFWLNNQIKRTSL